MEAAAPDVPVACWKFLSCRLETTTMSAGSVLHDLKDIKEPIIACDLGW